MLPIQATKLLEARAHNLAGAWGDYAAAAHDVETHAGALTNLLKRGDRPERAAQNPAVEAVLRLAETQEAVRGARELFHGALDDAEAAAKAVADPGTAPPAAFLTELATIRAQVDQEPAAARLAPSTLGMFSRGGSLYEARGAPYLLGSMLGAFDAMAVPYIQSMPIIPVGAVGVTALATTALGAMVRSSARKQATIAESIVVDRLARATVAAGKGTRAGRYIAQVPTAKVVAHVGTIASRADARTAALTNLAATIDDRVSTAYERGQRLALHGDEITQLRATTRHAVTARAAERAAIHEQLAVGVPLPAIAASDTVTAADLLAMPAVDRAAEVVARS